MRRPAYLLVSATVIACASATGVQRSVDALRAPDGVCAETHYVNPAGRRVRLQGCLRTGSAGMLFDNGEARLVTALEADDPADADLAEWQVQLLRDGERILNRALEPGPSHRRCGSFGLRCHERIADLALIAQPLGPGSYTIRYRLMSEIAYLSRRQPDELTIVLR